MIVILERKLPKIYYLLNHISLEVIQLIQIYAADEKFTYHIICVHD